MRPRRSPVSSSRACAPAVRAVLVALTLLLGALVLAACTQKKGSRLRVGVECAYPPFMELGPDGQPRGFEIDLATAIFKQAGVEHELIQSDFAGLIPGLLGGTFDALMASINITAERQKRVDFTIPYYRTPARFVRRKGSGIEVSREGLAGRRIGVQGTTNMDDWLTRTWGSVAEIHRYPTQDAVYLDMEVGRIEVMLVDVAAVTVAFLRRPGGEAHEFVGPALCDKEVVGEGVAIALPKGSADLRQRLDSAITAIRANGQYDAIKSKYFDFDLSCDR